MSAHGPMPRSAWIFPALGGRTFCRRHRPRTVVHAVAGRAGVRGGVAVDPVRHRVRGRPSCRSHRRAKSARPYGTLLLTLAVTIIEVALIATIMLGDKPVPALARDTVFAVVMIVCNGLVGLCIFVGGLRYREQDFSG